VFELNRAYQLLVCIRDINLLDMNARKETEAFLGISKDFVLELNTGKLVSS
jgi:hypothetical protein